MTKRSKRILSLLLSSAMVFTMNTAAFAGEASLDNAAKGHWDEKANRWVWDTQISYAEGTHKGVKDVVTIKNTTDPVSWNGAEWNGRDLISTVLAGTDSQDEYLNNSKKKTASNNGGAGSLQGEHSGAYDAYDVIDLTGGNYLFVGYGLNGGSSACVETTDDFVTYGKAAEQYGEFPEIPVIKWDGRAIDYNKSGLYKESKGKKEALDVKIALVKYENGTVTEIPGVEVGSVKVDKKAVKQASVSGSDIPVEKDRKYWDGEAEKSEKVKIDEYKIVNGATLPSFTVTAKVGKDAAAQKKAIADALKAKTYKFAIRRQTVDVYMYGAFAEAAAELESKELYKAYNETMDALEEEIINLTSETQALEVSQNELSEEAEKLETDKDALDPVADAERIAEIDKRLDEIAAKLDEIAEELDDIDEEQTEAEDELWRLDNYGTSYFKSKYGFKTTLSPNGIEKAIDEKTLTATNGSEDCEYDYFDDLVITKFTGKKATIVSRVRTGDIKKGYTKTADIVLKEKKDYTLGTGALAGETVTTLDFPETSNFEYDTDGLDIGNDDGTYVSGLASIGYKYAFRVAPTDKKKFRTGVFKADNEGFVYSAE